MVERLVGLELIENADMIYDILVSECGAEEEWRANFLYHFPQCVEYRFGGTLGLGGKIWANNGRIYVSCYPEDLTEERKSVIERANLRLAVCI